MSQLPQLRMRRPDLENIGDPIELPAGYLLRVGAAEDDGPMAELLTEAFAEEWNRDRVNSVLLQAADVGVVFVVEHAGQLVATASYQMKDEFPESGWLHYVGASAAHSGKRLGAAVTRRVLLEAKKRNRIDCYLTTDDFRLPAVWSYLKEGFVPDCWHESHEDRWAVVLEKLGESR